MPAAPRVRRSLPLSISALWEANLSTPRSAWPVPRHPVWGRCVLRRLPPGLGVRPVSPRRVSPAVDAPRVAASSRPRAPAPRLVLPFSGAGGPSLPCRGGEAQRRWGLAGDAVHGDPSPRRGAAGPTSSAPASAVWETSRLGLSPPRGPRTPHARGDRDLAALRGRGELAFGTQDPRRALRLRLRDASDFPSHFKTAGSRGPRWVHQRGLPRQDPLPELPRGSWSKLPSRALASAARLGEVPAPAHPAPGPGHLAPPPPRARLLLPPASLPRGERLSLIRRHRAVPSMPRTSEPASLPGHAGKSGTLGERARPDARPWPPPGDPHSQGAAGERQGKWGTVRAVGPQLGPGRALQYRRLRQKAGGACHRGPTAGRLRARIPRGASHLWEDPRRPSEALLWPQELLYPGGPASFGFRLQSFRPTWWRSH
nr:translation initiation factor IF-2-like [Chlorocebus sabaeus]XP_037852047.1 translation initiation factor IF-2-like [Chlorocebus sabaeus]XP_037852048.1 translation initiation factor IF-2-like [Chlorocebus sabaeus]